MPNVITVIAPCGHPIEFRVEYDEPDPSVGISGGWYVDDSTPEYCAECGHIFYIQEMEKIVADADTAAGDYKPDDGPDEPPDEEPYDDLSDLPY